MTKFLIAMIIVATVLVGGLIKLLRGAWKPIAPPDVLERAKQRNREIEEMERREKDY